MNHLNLPSYIVDHGAIVGCSIDVETDAGTVTLHRPFVPVGPGLAVTPAITADGPTLRIQLDSWIPMHHGGDRIVFLPLHMTTQSAAVVAIRAFTNDPTIAWTASHNELIAWCQAWITRNRTTKES
jgi:hypothetical protein